MGEISSASILRGQIVEVNKTNTGPTAGAWSNANNWLPTDVPRTLLEVQISNDGEAKTDVLTASGNIDINRFDVGRYATGECEQL